MKTLAERFWEKVDIRGEDECWLWLGGIPDRYGEFYDSGRMKKAHRVAYELSNGPIPDGLEILHTCDNPPCINPKHLFTGTHQDNMTDMVQKGRQVSLWGEKHPNAKLTTEQTEEIKRLCETGEFTQKELSERFGVYQTTISKIHRGVARPRG